LIALAILVTVVGTVVSAPATHGQGIPKIPFEKYTLANGLEVILHQDRSVPLVAVELWYKVGSGDEQKGRTGFAHLFEHVMFMGSENVPVGAFDQWLDERRAELAALEPGWEHPGDPRLPDAVHRH
jgi:zinc protease